MQNDTWRSRRISPFFRETHSWLSVNVPWAYSDFFSGSSLLVSSDYYLRLRLSRMPTSGPVVMAGPRLREAAVS